MDLNHTALTDLQNRLTKVEGSVGVPDDLKVVISTNSGTAVDVRGKGNLYMCGVIDTGNMESSSLDAIIDGVTKKVSYSKNGGIYGGHVSIQALLNINSSIAYTVLGCRFSTDNGRFRHERDSIPDDFQGKVCVTQHPVPFTSLKVITNRVSSSSYAIVAYTLDE